jgi:hypothetical protein
MNLKITAMTKTQICRLAVLTGDTNGFLLNRHVRKYDKLQRVDALEIALEECRNYSLLYYETTGKDSLVDVLFVEKILIPSYEKEMIAILEKDPENWGYVVQPRAINYTIIAKGIEQRLISSTFKNSNGAGRRLPADPNPFSFNPKLFNGEEMTAKELFDSVERAKTLMKTQEIVNPITYEVREVKFTHKDHRRIKQLHAEKAKNMLPSIILKKLQLQ